MIELLRISEILGYREIQYPEFPITEYRDGLIADKLLELVAIDTALREARLNSVAEMVGDMKLNYGAHMTFLRSEGSRLLKEIANLAGIPLAYDRYQNPNKRRLSFHNDYG